MTTFETPSFIGDEWLFNDGWSFGGEPDEVAPGSAWARFLDVLAENRRGNFEHVAVLAQLLAEEQPHPLFLGAMYLCAAAGDVRALLPWIDSDAFTQAASAVALAGDVSVVDALLERRRGAGPEIVEAMESTLSQLLEPEPERFYETELDDDSYDARIREHVAALVAKHGADTRFALGAPLRVSTLADKLELLADLEREERDAASATIGTLAFHLETLTGIPSKGIVTTDGSGAEIVDRARLGRVLETIRTWEKKHKPRSGRRLFFAHPVP
ncbi:MAG: hypothetical protein ABI321_24250 [Polyangia bacterium]